MDQRKQFVDAAMTKEEPLSRLCERFGISRKTGYKWLDRFLSGCELVERSRRPKRSPRAMLSSVEDAIVAWRRAHPRWGARKLRDAIVRANPGAEVPSVSAIGLVLSRNGLIVPSKRRKRITPSTRPLRHATAPNTLWWIDYKRDSWSATALLSTDDNGCIQQVSDRVCGDAAHRWSKSSARDGRRGSGFSAFPGQFVPTTVHRSRRCTGRTASPSCRSGG